MSLRPEMRVLADLACRPSPVCALASATGLSGPVRLPTLLEDGGHIPAGAEGSTGGSRQPDEPFTICDVQLHHPQIAVLAPSPLPVFKKI